MIKVEILVGIPASGKSTYAKQLVAKDPANWARINNDDLRAMLNGSVYSSDYEKMITDARNYLIRDALKRERNIVIDNLNLNKRHFEDISKIAKGLNKDIQIYEKVFYIDLEEAIERDSKREGKSKVGKEVILKWWKSSGGKQLKFYNPRTAIFRKNQILNAASEFQLDPNLPTAIICDLDGTLALINRNPYDATDCDIKDLPNTPVIETVLAHYNSGKKIIFCSGREDKYRPETERFIKKHCPSVDYQLFMRKSGDFRKDAIVKDEIFQNNIEGKYNVLLVLDDRNQVVSYWRSKGLTCFQVAEGNF
jgi:predicted kinase